MSNKYFMISQEALNRYPDSFLAIKTFTSFQGDDIKDGIRTSLSDLAMVNIVRFYEKHTWISPDIYDNQWSVDDLFIPREDNWGRFNRSCIFLGLPNYIEEDDEEEEDKLWGGMGYEEEELEYIKKEYRKEQWENEQDRLRIEKEEKMEERTIDTGYAYDEYDFYDIC